MKTHRWSFSRGSVDEDANTLFGTLSAVQDLKLDEFTFLSCPEQRETNRAKGSATTLNIMDMHEWSCLIIRIVAKDKLPIHLL